MISKKAIRDFLNRDLDDWSCVKKLSEVDIWNELDLELPKDFSFKTTPWKHQASSFICGLHNKDFIFLLDMGLGKSKVVTDVLSLYAHNRALDEREQALKGRTLIVAPNEVGIGSWEDQIKEHSDFTYTSLLSDKEDKWDLFENTNTNFYIISYGGLISMLTAIVKPKKGSKETKVKRKAIDKLVKKFSKSFQGIIVDELHRVSNASTLSYKLCNKVAAQAYFRYGLTGTPIGRDPIDFWAQFYLIDRGETLGTTLGLFREAFFKKESNGFGYKYVFNTKLEKKLHKMLSHRSIRYSEEELDSMPPKVYSMVKVSFPSENYQYYEKAVKGLVEARGNYEMIKNAFVRLRTITAGFLDFKDEDGNRERIIFKENYLLDALIDDIENTPVKAKIVIFYEYTFSGDMVVERLKNKKIKFERLYSGTKDKILALNNFTNNPYCKILLANSKSGGENLNLQVADYEFFYESPVSPRVRRQAEKRAPRGDKKETTYIRDFVVKNSVDEDVLEFIREGKNLFDSIVEGKSSIEIK